MASTERPAARKRGDDDAQMIRKATTTILAQASSVNLDCWEFLVRSLRSPEPAIRHMALIGVDHSLGPVPADSSTSQPTRREIVSVLGDILANDVDERNRSLAAVVLGRVCGSFGLSMPSTARDGFAWCLKHFMLLQQDAPRPGLGPARCCALHAIGKLVEDNVDVQDGDFDKLADQLLQVLVGGPDDAEGDVQRAHAISLLARLPATNRNRQRVMRFWPCLRSLIRRLMYAPGGGADAILTTAISKFASQWYQRVPDAILDRFPLYDQLSGYAELQYSVLLNAEAEGTANPRNRLRAEIGPAEYLGIADRDHVMQFLKRYSRRVQIADLLPEKFDLTFQAEALNNEMFFDTLHPTRVLHLTNRSAKTAHLFTVQVAPTRFFSVSPAFGEIAPHTSLPITITFTRAYPAEKGTGRGYIRLRSWTGFAFERLSLRFYNGPFVQIVNTTVDFGPCPPGRRFLRKVFVKNIGINDIVCAVDLIQVAAGMTDDPVSTFELSPRSGVIAPNSTMGFDVVFTAAPGAPRADATLSFSGVGQSDANEVVLSGSTGFPLKFDEDLIDMGPCQLLERVSTAVNVTNLAPFPLFVQFDGTVDNLVIESVTIPALQTRTISVAWEANVVGDVNELVYVRVPHCAPTTIAFAAFVGPILTTPMAPRLQMPFVSVHFVLQSVIPVHNRSRYDAEFVVDGLDGTPFLVTVVDPLRHAKDVAAFDGDMAGKQAPQRFKDMLAQTRNKVHSVKARSTVYLHVLFTSHKPGFFEREFVVGVVAPRPTKWRPFMLRAAAVLDNEKFPLKKLLLFLGEDGVFKAADLTRLPSKDFEGAIESRMIFGDTWSGISHRNETFAFGSREEWGWAQRPLPPVVVENLSSRPHNFSMMVTWPFVGTNARHGICGAFDKMLIPNDISPEYHHADETTPVDGFVVVRDNFSKTSICHIHHVPTHIVVVDAARHHRSRIVFPVVEVGVVSIVPIVVENRSGLTVAFRIVIDDGGVDTGFSSDDQLAHPLQAWEMRSVPIRFQSSIKGQYVSRLQVVYEDPSTPTNTFVAFECELVGVAGHADLEVSTAVVDFGNCGVGALAEGDLAVANHDDVDLPLNVVVSEPFALASTADTVDVDQVVILPAGRSAPVRLQFRPMASGRFWTRMQFVKGDAAHDVVLFGEGGVMSLTSSMGPPVQVIEQQQQRIPGNENGAKVDSSSSSSSNGTGEIDMGTVRVCTVATRPLRLINNGTIDIVLSNIVAIADEGLSYAFMDGDIVATGAGDLPQFGRELPDALAIDWDEVAYQRAHAAAQQQQQQQRQGDPGKTTTATTATASMESAFPKVLQPGGSLTLQLSFSRYLTGIFHPWLRIMTVERGGEPRERFSFALKFNVQDVMDISESALEFGVVPIGHIARLTMSFYNECTQAVPWRVVVTDLVATQTVGDRQRAPVRNDTFACEPASGVLAGGHEQVVTVSFVTIVPHLSMTASATLHTSDIGVTKIGVSAMSGAPMIVASEPDIRFGCIGLGSTKSKVLMLVNEGELPAAFLLRTPSKLFHIVPTRGTIAPKSRQPLWIKFAPVDSEAISVQLRVDWGDHFDRLKSRLMIPMSGQGGSSQVVVKVSTVDFGMTMLGTDAVQTLRVFNTGTAEALVEIDLPDPSLRADCDNVFFVEPHQHRDLQLIFHPTTPVAINAPASLFSKDSTQDRITIQIKGRVGVPCIELGPPGAVDSNTLNMGICMVRKPTQRSFYVDNTGNMDVPFEVVVLRQQAQTGAEQTRAPQDAQAGNAAMFAVESKFPRLAPRDPQWALLADKLVPAHAGDTFFKIEPMSGVFATGSRVTFAVEFLPPASEIVLDVLVLVRNPFAPFGLVATAISDEPTIEIDIPERVLDFGLCRCHNTFKRRFRVLNKGNVAYSYHLGPDVRDPQWATFRDDYEAARLIWAAQMKALGFTTSYNGTCPRKGYSDVTIAFTPTKAGEVSASVRVVCSGGYEQLDVRGVGGISALDLTRPVGVDGGVAGSVAANFCDFGLRPIGRPQQMTLLLRNRGTLPSGFLVRRTMPDAFVVQPLSGRIGAGAEVPLSVTFRPRAHGLSQFDLLVRGIDNTVAPCRIVGRGGDGVLGVRYLHDRDADLRGIEFGLVNVGVVVEKSLLLYNEGQVELRLWAECDDRAFAIRLQRDPQPFKAMVDLDCLPRQQGYHRVVSRVMTPDTKFADAMLFAQMRTLETTIPPGQFVVAAIALAAHEPRRYAGILTLACEFNRMGVPLRAEGGTVHIAHQGDLNFGSVGVDHVYERTVTLVNTGSISTQGRLSWSIPGAAHRAAAIVALGDPNGTPARRLWQRSIRFVVRLLRVAKIASRFGTLEQMLEAITADRKNRAMRIKQVANANQQRSLQEQLDAVTTTALEQRQSAKDVQAALPQNHPAFDAAVSLREAGNLVSLRMALLQDRIEKRIATSDVAQESPLTTLMDYAGSNVTSLRTAAFGSLRREADLTTGGPAGQRGQLAVSPARVTLDVDVPVTLSIRASFPPSDAFVGALLVTPDLLGCDEYALSVAARPMSAKMTIDNAGPLSFGRISLGTMETVTRTLTNNGLLPIKFAVRHRNFGLTVTPGEGLVEAEDTCVVTFQFRPVDEEWQRSPITIETDSTDAIVIPFDGAGGVPKLHIASFERFDFGRCMAGRVAKRSIRLFNTGNAQLPVVRCMLDQTMVFSKGASWPVTRFMIDPGAYFDLNVEFMPQSEDVFRGRVVIETDTRIVPIELMGTGREALLSFQAQNVDLANTIVGNVYRREMIITNISDLEYPLQLSIVEPGGLTTPLTGDFKLEATDLVLAPFEQRHISFSYKASRECDTQVLMHMSSIFSENDVPIPVMTGTAIVSVDTDEVDFGQFQQGYTCSRTITIRNTGTIAVAFRIHSSRDQDVLGFSLSRWRGLLVPNRDVEITIKTTLTTLTSFDDELCLETQVEGQRHFIRVRGQCDTPVIDKAKFQRVDFGDCLVGEAATETFVIENTGGFPLTYRMKATFPVRIAPTNGSIAGNSRQRFTVTWVPSGGYSLRSTIKAHTNLGIVDINLKGRGAYPRFTISNAYLDFGVGAINHVYEQRFKVINRSRVGIRWTNPAVEEGFHVAPRKGSLAEGESVIVRVRFEPKEFKRYTGTVVIESKGRYREVQLNGIGGVLRLDTAPELDIGDCPAGYWRQAQLPLANVGDVPLSIRASPQGLDPGFTVLVAPESLAIAPLNKDSLRVRVRADESYAGRFHFTISLMAPERTWKVTVRGTAVSLRAAFSSLTSTLLRADGNLMRGAPRWQQWPNALALPDELSVNDGAAGGRNREDVRSVVELLVTAVEEMVRQGDRTTQQSFGELLTAHIDEGRASFEASYQDRDRIAGIVTAYAPLITDADIRKVTALKEPSVDNELDSTLTASPPIFLPELTCI